MPNEAGVPYVSIFKNMEPVESSAGNRFQVEIWKFRPKIADFSRNPVEISEVLPVEISTMKSGMKNIFAGNKNYVIWTHR